MTYTSVSSAAAVVLGYLISYLTATLLTEPFVRDSSGTSRNKKLLSDGSLTAPAIMTVNTLLENWSVLLNVCMFFKLIFKRITYFSLIEGAYVQRTMANSKKTSFQKCGFLSYQ